MKKSILYTSPLFLLLFLGCANEESLHEQPNNLENTTENLKPNEILKTAHFLDFPQWTKKGAYQEFPFKNFVDVSVSENVENPEAIWEEIRKVIDPGTLLSEKGTEVQFRDIPESSHDMSEIAYQFQNDTYVFSATKYPNKDANVPSAYSVKKNGNPLFSSPMCYGTEGPVLDFRLVENEITFTYTTTECLEESFSKKVATDIYYQGKRINKEYGLESSKYLFAYKGKIGFVLEKDGKEFIAFNETILPYKFDEISTYTCCSRVRFFKLYDNGALLFFGTQEKEGIIAEIDLNKYL